jgi:hypothetical protein
MPSHCASLFQMAVSGKFDHFDHLRRRESRILNKEIRRSGVRIFFLLTEREI